jgi:hypothetical protein
VRELMAVAMAADGAMVAVRLPSTAVEFIDSSEWDAQERLDHTVQQKGGLPYAIVRYRPGEIAARLLDNICENREHWAQHLFRSLTYAASLMTAENDIAVTVQALSDGWTTLTYGGRGGEAALCA